MLPIAEAARASFPAVDLDESRPRADVRVGRALDLRASRPGGAVRARRASSSRSTSGGTGPGPSRSSSEPPPVVFRPCEIWRSTGRRAGRPRPHGRGHRQLRRRPPRAPPRHRAARARSPTSDGLPSWPSPSTRTRWRCSVPSTRPLTLTDIERALRAARGAGADDVLRDPVPREIAAWTPEEFVDRVLVDGLHAAAVVVGANFRFGHRAAGDVAMLEPRPGGPRTSRPRASRWTADPRCGPRPTSAPAWPPGDVAGAAEALGRPFTVARPRRRAATSAAASSATRPPTSRHAGRRRPRRRGVRRLAAPRSTTGDALPAAISVGHQPHLRRATASAGSRPTCSTATTSSSTTPRWRSPSSTGSAGWSPSTRSTRSSRTMAADVDRTRELLAAGAGAAQRRHRDDPAGGGRRVVPRRTACPTSSRSGAPPSRDCPAGPTRCRPGPGARGAAPVAGGLWRGLAERAQPGAGDAGRRCVGAGRAAATR